MRLSYGSEGKESLCACELWYNRISLEEPMTPPTNVGGKRRRRGSKACQIIAQDYMERLWRFSRRCSVGSGYSISALGLYRFANPHSTLQVEQYQEHFLGGAINVINLTGKEQTGGRLPLSGAILHSRSPPRRFWIPLYRSCCRYYHRRLPSTLRGRKGLKYIRSWRR